jgi:serine/threonine protein kinase
MLSGLGVAHDVGVVHRDLKPENVFLVAEPNGETLLKLIDFGLARIDDEAPDSQGPEAPRQRVGSLYAGTPEYFSPEQALQEAVGPAADLYAVGVILFEMVAGRLPFEGTVAQLLQQHASAIPPSLSDVADGVPDGLTSLVRRLLDKEPSQRPRTAQLARQEVVRLQKALHAAGTQVRRIEPEVSTRKIDAGDAPKRTRRTWLVVPAALVLVGAVIAVMLTRIPAPEPTAPPPEPAVPLVERTPPSLPPLEPVVSPEPAPVPVPEPVPVVTPPKGPTASVRPNEAKACQDLDARREAMLERFDATKTALRAKLADKPAAVRDAALKRADDVRTRLRTANTPAACRLATTGFERWLESFE